MNVIFQIFLVSCVLVSEATSEVKGRRRPCPVTTKLIDVDFSHLNILQPPLNAFSFLNPALNFSAADWAFLPRSTLTPLGFTNDGSYSSAVDGGYIASFPFKQSQNQTVNLRLAGDSSEHTHFGIVLNIAKSNAKPPLDAITKVTFRSAARIYPAINPFPKSLYVTPDDFRFGCAGMILSDIGNGIGFGWVQTNSRVYVHVGRQFLRPGSFEKPYAVFNSFIPVAYRKPSDVNQMDIIFDGYEKKVHFELDGKRVYTWHKVGYRTDARFITLEEGGPDVEVWPLNLPITVGTFNFLAMQATCTGAIFNGCELKGKCKFPKEDIALVRPFLPDSPIPTYNARQPTQNLTYYDNNGLWSNRIYGQGVIQFLGDLQVTETRYDL